MFHCEASLVEAVDDVAVDDVRRFFFFLHDELYIALEKTMHPRGCM